MDPTQDVSQPVEALLASAAGDLAVPAADKVPALGKVKVAGALGGARSLGVSNEGVKKLHRLATDVKRKRTALAKVDRARQAVDVAKVKTRSVLAAMDACTKLLECIDELTERALAAEDLSEHYDVALTEIKRLRSLNLQFQRPSVLAYDTTGTEVLFWAKEDG
jgi:hypothetical protein